MNLAPIGGISRARSNVDGDVFGATRGSQQIIKLWVEVVGLWASIIEEIKSFGSRQVRQQLLVWVAFPESVEKAKSAWCVLVFDGAMSVQICIVESVLKGLDNEALMVFSCPVWNIGQGHESIEEFTVKM
jgi:hypothetical protein